MSWRSVVITQPTKLSIKNRQLQITQDEDFSMPLEDISTIVLETTQINLSSKAMSMMADNKIVMYSCDDKHLPNGIFIPFACHSRQLKVINQQLNCSESFNKRCWQRIIISKITNQAKVLSLCNKSLMSEHLQNLAQNVNSGDTKNKEAIAAKGYFPSIGIHHKSELNNYNLADDFIEPFRPIVDLWVKTNVNENTEFNKFVRAELVNLLNVDVYIQGRLQSVNNAINIMIASYTTAINQNDYKKLELPEILPIKMHSYE